MTTTEAIRITTTLASDAAAKITRCWGPLWKVLSFSLADDRIASRHCVSVLLENGGLSVAYGSRFLSRLQIKGIRRYPSEEGKYPTTEGLASAVELAVNDLRATRAQVTLVIPKAWAIVKTTEFPLAVKAHLSDVISYELDRLTPFSSERAFYDFRILAEDADRIRIMLVAMKADTLQPYLEALRAKGISVKRVVVSLSAFGTLSHYVHGGGDTIFLDVHSGGYEGGQIREGRWRASFAGNFASADDEEKIRLLTGEIHPLIESAKEEGKMPPAIFVHRQFSTEWLNVLSRRLDSPVRFLNESDVKPLLLKTEKAEELPYTTLGGILESLWAGAEGMNLLDKGVHRAPKTPLAPTVVLIVLLAALGFFWLMSPLQIEEKKIEAIDWEITARRDEVKKVEALQKELEGLEKEISTIYAFKSTRPMMLSLLREMTAVLPKNTWLSRLRITESSVEIEGYASSAQEILPKLEASKYFKKVEFAAPTSRDVRLNADRFVIKMEIEGLPEGKATDGKKE